MASSGVQNAELQHPAVPWRRATRWRKTVVRLEDKRRWLDVVDPAANRPARVRLVPTSTGATAGLFLAALREKRRIDDAGRPVDSAPRLQAAMHRLVYRLQDERDGNRSPVVRIIRTIKLATDQFSNRFGDGHPATAESWLLASESWLLAFAVPPVPTSIHSRHDRPGSATGFHRRARDPVRSGVASVVPRARTRSASPPPVTRLPREIRRRAGVRRGDVESSPGTWTAATGSPTARWPR